MLPWSIFLNYNCMFLRIFNLFIKHIFTHRHIYQTAYKFLVKYCHASSLQPHEDSNSVYHVYICSQRNWTQYMLKKYVLNIRIYD